MGFVGKLTAQNKHQLRASIVTNLPSYIAQIKNLQGAVELLLTAHWQKNRLFCKKFPLSKGKPTDKKCTRVAYFCAIYLCLCSFACKKVSVDFKSKRIY